MEPLFQIGQTVIINLQENVNYPFGINSYMLSLSGKSARIIGVIPDYYENNSYHSVLGDRCKYLIDIDKNGYSWSSPMFRNFNLRKLSIY